MAADALDRPMRLGEVLAETVRIYGERFGAALGLGLAYAGVFIGASYVGGLGGLAIYTIAIALAFAAAARIVSGDAFGAAWSAVVPRLPALLVLAVVVALPFALAVSQLILLLLGAAWLAYTSFAVPVVMVEVGPEDRGGFAPLAHAFRRTAALARADYLHAAGVVSALVILYLLVGLLIASLLVSFADNGGVAAVALVQVVLAPFFFLGLSVLYFEQRARLAQAPAPSAREARTR